MRGPPTGTVQHISVSHTRLHLSGQRCVVACVAHLTNHLENACLNGRRDADPSLGDALGEQSHQPGRRHGHALCRPAAWHESVIMRTTRSSVTTSRCGKPGSCLRPRRACYVASCLATSAQSERPLTGGVAVVAGSGKISTRGPDLERFGLFRQEPAQHGDPHVAVEELSVVPRRPALPSTLRVEYVSSWLSVHINSGPGYSGIISLQDHSTRPRHVRITAQERTPRHLRANRSTKRNDHLFSFSWSRCSGARLRASSGGASIMSSCRKRLRRSQSMRKFCETRLGCGIERRGAARSAHALSDASGQHH